MYLFLQNDSNLKSFTKHDLKGDLLVAEIFSRFNDKIYNVIKLNQILLKPINILIKIFLRQIMANEAIINMTFFKFVMNAVAKWTPRFFVVFEVKDD